MSLKYLQCLLLIIVCNKCLNFYYLLVKFLVTGPIKDIQKINNMIGAKKSQGSSDYYISCQKRNLPNITISIAGEEFILTRKDYILQINVSLNLLLFSVII